jgi:hypothetical protein
MSWKHFSYQTEITLDISKQMELSKENFMLKSMLKGGKIRTREGSFRLSSLALDFRENCSGQEL